MSQIPTGGKSFTKLNPHLFGVSPGRKPNSGDVDREGTLHEEIIEYCKNRRWVCFHSRMDRKQHANLGMPDFVVAKDDGQTIYAEAKRPGGKLTPAQRAILHWLQLNGQRAGVVTSLEEFQNLSGGS